MKPDDGTQRNVRLTPSGLTADEYIRRYMDRPVREDDPLYDLPTARCEQLHGDWTRGAPPFSKHLELAIAAAFRRRQFGRPPLWDGEPIPGCGCEQCTGVAKDAPARVVPLKTRARRASYRAAADAAKAAARAVPILEVVQHLGLEPVRKGRIWVAHCPLHDDRRPSLNLDPAKGVWYCHPCAEGGDGIRLIQRAKGLSFVDAVRELAA